MTSSNDTTPRLARLDRSSSAAGENRAVRFYESDVSLARIVGGFLEEGFQRGSPGIIVATADQRAAIVQELTGRSFDVAALQRSSDLVLLDAAVLLSTFMVDGQPDAGKFKDQMCRLVETVRGGRPVRTVRVFGQMVDVLWQQGQRDAAIRLEVLWNQLAQAQASSLVCGYAIGNFYKDASFEDVCGVQSRPMSTDGLSRKAVSTAGEKSERAAECDGR